MISNKLLDISGPLMLSFCVFATLHPRSVSSPLHLRVHSELCVKISPSFYYHCYTSPETSVNSDQNRLFQISALRTLPSSVSSKSFACRSYAKCRVYINNSHSGTQRPPVNSPSLIPYPLSPSFSYSCALFCANEKLNSFIFNCFRTLCPKHPGGGGHCCRHALRASRRGGTNGISDRKEEKMAK